jgi:23S rRNA pseudouridine2605 synthase
MRLNRFLAAAGLGSRRYCDELIRTGQVTINGAVCTDFSAQPAENDYVKVRGKRVQVEKSLYLMMNKPPGFVSTRTDPNVRHTIFGLLPARFPRVFNIGRLDNQSEGLLILTNDGDLAQRLAHPRHHIEKEYEVTLDRAFDQKLIPRLRAGLPIDGQQARMEKVELIKPTRLRVVLRQGINRQIRRMLATFGYDVKKLVRIRIGTLRLGQLPPGQWRLLTKTELRSLQAPPDLSRGPRNLN